MIVPAAERALYMRLNNHMLFFSIKKTPDGAHDGLWP